jgi:hypothetical protein
MRHLGVWLSIYLGVCAPQAAHAQSPLESPARESIRTALLSESLTLRGSESSADLIVNLPDPSERASAVELELPISVSDNVLATSTLTLELQGQPLQSVFVRRLPTQGAWRIPLPELPAGYFALRLRTRLLTAGDPCHDAQHQPPTLTLHASAGLVYARRLRPPAPLAVAALLTRINEIIYQCKVRKNLVLISAVIAVCCFCRNINTSNKKKRVKNFLHTFCLFKNTGFLASFTFIYNEWCILIFCISLREKDGIQNTF